MRRGTRIRPIRVDKQPLTKEEATGWARDLRTNIVRRFIWNLKQFKGEEPANPLHNTKKSVKIRLPRIRLLRSPNFRA